MNEGRRALVDKVSLSMFGVTQRYFEKGSIAEAERRGEKWGLIAYRLDKKHRIRTHANLKIAFPEWSPAAWDEGARNVYRHFGILASDFFRTRIRSNQEVLDNVEVTGTENLEAAESLGPGIIALTAHLGNWERFAQYCTGTGRAITVVARDANDGALQQKVLTMREATGVKVLSRGSAATALLRELKRGGLVGILPDQNASECFVPFFGQPCGTVLGPAKLHLRTGAALLPAYCVRVGVGKYRVIILPAINLDRAEQDPERLTAAANFALESVIRQFPSQYLWMHDRWKSARQRGMLQGTA
jgi:KDO2-lipid IV(A) lauroyltransferase